MCNNQYIPVTPQILITAMQGKINAISRYQQMYQIAKDPQETDILRKIHNDVANHYNALAALYQQMTGTAPPPLQPATAPLPSLAEGVKEAIRETLQDSEYFRCIALGCDNPSQRMFWDIALDGNGHAAWLHYLYLYSLAQDCEGSAIPQPEPEPEPEPQPEPQPQPQPVSCVGVTHSVQPGESLWSIGGKYGVTVEAILAENPQITDPSNLYVGQIVCIPCIGAHYIMQAGDSLWLIAQRYGLTVEDLVAANPFLTDPANIAVGQLLCIPILTPAPTSTRDSLTYLYGGTSAYYLGLLENTQGSINIVCPDFFELDEGGNLLMAASEKLNAPFISTLHGMGIQVTPFLSNHWARALGNTALDNRQQLSTQIANAVVQYGLDGVNVDIENVSHEYRSAYVDLTRLLREKLPAGKTVSVAVAANPNGWTAGWHGSYDYKALAQYCDYLVIMAYDESYQGGPEGPVSSSGFFERSIQYALEQGVPREQIIVAIPFFGRYWKQGGTVGGIGLAARDVENLLASYESSNEYDAATQSALAVVTIRPGDPEPQIWGGRKLTAGTYRIWYDNEQATRYKLNTIGRYGLRGAGSWALGQEIPAIWSFYTQALNQS